MNSGTTQHRQAMPVFVVGLKRFPQRHERTLQQLGDAGIDAQFFPGVDLVGGDTLASEEKVNPYPHFFRLGSWPLGLGEVGCYFAHYRVLKHILTLEASRALILECDAIAQVFTKEVIDEVAALDEKYELVYLFSANCPRGDVVRTLPHKHVLRRCLGPSYGAVAYAITRPAAEKLLPQALPMRAPYDALLGNPRRTGLETFGMQPYTFATPLDRNLSIIRNVKTRWMPSNPVHRAFYRMLCALLAKLIRSSRGRWIKPLRPEFWRRLKKGGRG